METNLEEYVVVRSLDEIDRPVTHAPTNVDKLRYYKVPTAETEGMDVKSNGIPWENDHMLATRFTLEGALSVLFDLKDKYHNRYFAVKKLAITMTEVEIEIGNAN